MVIATMDVRYPCKRLSEDDRKVAFKTYCQFLAFKLLGRTGRRVLVLSWSKESC